MNRFSLLLLSALWLLPCTTAMAQNDTLRQVSVQIVNRKNKPVAGILVHTSASTVGAITDQDGHAKFDGLSDADSLFASLPALGLVAVPLDGLDSVLIRVRSEKRYNVVDLKDLHKTTPTSDIDDVQAYLKKRPVRTVAELLQGIVPGLTIHISGGGEVSSNIRGINSINMSNEPLVVVDGTTYESLSAVNSMLDVHSIKSIKVLKDGGLYGVRGANGVIVITTIGYTGAGY